MQPDPGAEPVLAEEEAGDASDGDEAGGTRRTDRPAGGWHAADPVRPDSDLEPEPAAPQAATGDGAPGAAPETPAAVGPEAPAAVGAPPPPPPALPPVPERSSAEEPVVAMARAAAANARSAALAVDAATTASEAAERAASSASAAAAAAGRAAAAAEEAAGSMTAGVGAAEAAADRARIAASSADIAAERAAGLSDTVTGAAESVTSAVDSASAAAGAASAAATSAQHAQAASATTTEAAGGTLSRAGEVLDRVEALEAAVTATLDRLGTFVDGGLPESLETMRSEFGTSLSQLREATAEAHELLARETAQLRTQVSTTIEAANRWFVRTRDQLYQRLDRVDASAGGAALAAQQALADLRGLLGGRPEGDVEAWDGPEQGGRRPLAVAAVSIDEEAMGAALEPLRTDVHDLRDEITAMGRGLLALADELDTLRGRPPGEAPAVPDADLIDEVVRRLQPVRLDPEQVDEIVRRLRPPRAARRPPARSRGDADDQVTTEWLPPDDEDAFGPLAELMRPAGSPVSSGPGHPRPGEHDDEGEAPPVSRRDGPPAASPAARAEAPAGKMRRPTVRAERAGDGPRREVPPGVTRRPTVRAEDGREGPARAPQGPATRRTGPPDAAGRGPAQKAHARKVPAQKGPARKAPAAKPPAAGARKGTKKAAPRTAAPSAPPSPGRSPDRPPSQPAAERAGDATTPARPPSPRPASPPDKEKKGRWRRR